MRTFAFAVLALLACVRAVGAQTEQYAPRAFAHEGHEYVAVVVGSSHCGFSTWDKYVAVINPMLLDLRKQAQQRGALFTAIGVAVDEPESGLAYLSRLAKFDEISSGGTWFNTGVLHYLWADGAPEPSTPTVLLLERTFSDGVTTRPEKDGAKSRTRKMETRRLRLLEGADSIMAFARAGAPLPK